MIARAVLLLLATPLPAARGRRGYCGNATLLSVLNW